MVLNSDREDDITNRRTAFVETIVTKLNHRAKILGKDVMKSSIKKEVDKLKFDI